MSRHSIKRVVGTAGVLIAFTAALVHCGAGPDAGLSTPQEILDTHGQAFYQNAYTLLDLPWEDLVEALPELHGLEPASDQGPLARILREVGKSVEESYRKFTEIVANEEVTQEKCSSKDHLETTLHQGFSYLILPRYEDGRVRIDEYRTDLEGKPIGGSIEGSPFTVGYASVWALFHPANQPDTKFRYLGQQQPGGHLTQLVGFAQKPGWSVIRGVAISEGQRIELVNQGVAWIDAATHKIVEIRTELLKPRLDVKLERQTTEIRFGEVHLSTPAASPLWVPLQVTVTTIWNGQLIRDRHLYSNYQLPGSNTKIKPAPEEAEPRPKTN